MVRPAHLRGVWIFFAILLTSAPPQAAAAQTEPFQFRVTGGTFQLLGDDYFELEPGLGFALDLIFPGSGVRFGLGAEYAEFPIENEEERLVSGALDAFLDLYFGAGVFMELRGGFERQAWDVLATRYHVNGVRGGGGLGFRLPAGRVAEVEMVLSGGYFLGLTGTFNGEEMGYLESGPRLALRAGVRFPGVVR